MLNSSTEPDNNNNLIVFTSSAKRIDASDSNLIAHNLRKDGSVKKIRLHIATFYQALKISREQLPVNNFDWVRHKSKNHPTFNPFFSKMLFASAMNLSNLGLSKNASSVISLRITLSLLISWVDAFNSIFLVPTRMA